MANWCSNRVEFTGEHSQFGELQSFFTAMAAKEKKEGKGQLPDFASGGTGFMFETAWEDGILYYNTKWSPNTDVIVKIADQFKTGFIYSYAETSNGEYGEATYSNGELTDIALDWSDTDHYSFNEETDLYEFEGMDYESEEDILAILLQRRKNAHAQIALIAKTN